MNNANTGKGDTIVLNYILNRERSGSVVECLTRDRGAAGRASPALLHCGP